MGTVPPDGRPGPSGASGGGGRGHRPLDVSLYAPGGPDRGAQGYVRAPDADRGYGPGGDHSRAHSPRDNYPVRVAGRFAGRFSYCFSLGLAVPLDGSANAAPIIARRPYPTSSAFSPECVEDAFSELRPQEVPQRSSPGSSGYRLP